MYKLQEYLQKKLKVNKPYALGWGEWEVWENEFKKNRPIAFFITETVFDWISTLDRNTLGRLHRLRTYFLFRYAIKSHIMESDLKKGDYHEFDKLLLHSAFEGVVHFVEHDCALHSVVFNREESEKYETRWSRLRRKFTNYRNAEAGLSHLEWEMSLDFPESESPSPEQAKAARETLVLYTWWKYTRPQRPDASDACGLTDFHKKMDEKYKGKWLFSDKLDASEQSEFRRLINESNNIQNQYNDEDDEMLIRLVKHRSRMWT